MTAVSARPPGMRSTALPALAVLLISGTLGVQVASGGGTFTPLRPADPCVTRVVTSASTGIEGLSERLVLIGLDRAGCRLGMTREALVLLLAQPGRRTDTQIAAIRAGLLDAVARLKADGSLPPASDLVGEALDKADLNGFLKAAIRALPDSLVNSALKTDDVLRRTVRGLDLRTVLADLDNPDDLTRQINAAVTQAVRASLLARLRGLI